MTRSVVGSSDAVAVAAEWEGREDDQPHQTLL